MIRGIVVNMLSAVSNSVSRLLNNFKRILKQWHEWDHITMLANHQVIRCHLVDCCSRDLRVCFCESSSLFPFWPACQCCHPPDAPSLFHQLLALDDIGMCTHLEATVENGIQYKAILARDDAVSVQKLIDLLQAVCCYPLSACNWHKFKFSAWTFRSIRYTKIVTSKHSLNCHGETNSTLHLWTSKGLRSKKIHSTGVALEISTKDAFEVKRSPLSCCGFTRSQTWTTFLR